MAVVDILAIPVERIRTFKATHPLRVWNTGTNVIVTATLAAPGAGWRNRLLRVDASYSTSTTSGLLTIKSGATTIAQKTIHGSGAFDFDLDVGFPSINLNEAVSAELAAGGASIIGNVFVQGFLSQ